MRRMAIAPGPLPVEQLPAVRPVLAVLTLLAAAALGVLWLRAWSRWLCPTIPPPAPLRAFGRAAVSGQDTFSRLDAAVSSDAVGVGGLGVLGVSSGLTRWPALSVSPLDADGARVSTANPVTTASPLLVGASWLLLRR